MGQLLSHVSCEEACSHAGRGEGICFHESLSHPPLLSKKTEPWGKGQEEACVGREDETRTAWPAWGGVGGFLEKPG
jgi:hypothetical protein